MVLAHGLENGSRTQDVRISEDIMFNTMLLSQKTVDGLKKAGFYKPSPIQLQGIPLGKCGFDLLLEAKSGTGKTAVFSVIALEKFNLKQGIQTVILAPTREIAFQIHDVIKQIGIYYEGLQVEVLIGGMPVQDDIDKLQKHVHIIVGSPGRIKHMIQDKHLKVSCVRLLVLDEADKLMEKSFLSDIDYIFKQLPKQKQVIMSSATYPEQSKEFVYKYVKNAQHVCPDTNCILLGIEQKVIIVPSNSNIVTQTKIRYKELQKILSQMQFKQCLIFCNYQARVGELHKMLSRHKWPTEQLYGQQEQTERLDALKTLQEYKCRILISTDLAARGIDASNVDLVINFEPPFEWQTYLHRIGRAGRYGSYGTAITILSEGTETQKLKEILGQTGLPLNLKNMWNETPFKLQNSEVKSESIKADPETMKQDKDINETNNDLWNILIDGSNKIKVDDATDLLSFDNLCKSFENCQVANGIESFSDLLTSFQNNEIITNTEISYKTVKTNKLSVLNRLSREDTVPDISDNFLHYNTESNTQEVPIKLSSSEDESQSDFCTSDTSKPTKHALNDAEQALIEAGLPTAFGKSPQIKEKRPNEIRHTPKNRHQFNRNDKANTNRHNMTYSSTHDMNKGDFVEDIDHEQDSLSTSINNSDDDSSSAISQSSIKTASFEEYFYLYKPQTKDVKVEKSRTVDLKLQRINEFNAWYKKLQDQSKMIEQIVYLEEMSKLL